MTARLLSNPVEAQFLKTASLNHYFLNSQIFTRRTFKSPMERRDEVPTASTSVLEMLWSTLLEALPQGVVVLSRNMQPLYLNERANHLCQLLASGDRQPASPPLVISEIGHRLLKNASSTKQPLVVERQTPQGHLIRIRASWLQVNPTDGVASSANDSQYILVILENCTEVLREELQIEQKRYDLTERETEIWMLLRQEYSYQEIAKTLRISLNTVKTHVKNVYAKKRSCQGREQVVVF
ncbi:MULTISPECIES: LuxR C-terminal-related transcriptional regulator [Trichocoleus]|uniref:LuxR C-terminal-related transcriptional regulator n=1 Tax=Trichocoleus desertorum GB2-A4 TaxID=2933944 RepID=A0ABV0JG28_9CYAN|nr:LuxR C-terminal-related transcriptional regulator [Trichocoleus sp. FACHB-46]MBD1862971.1 response regulator transcription factor [Trichocoleus sp. FACHB-46]